MFEIWDILRPLVKLCLYPAMFVAAGGLLIFELVFAPQLADDMRTYLRRLITGAAWAGLALVAAQVMVAAGSLGGDLASTTDTALLGLVMKSPLGLFSIVAGIGFAMITVMHRVKARGEQAARVVAAATVLLSLTVVGHATRLGAVTGVLLAIHLGGIAFWLGALLPLRRMCLMAPETGSQSLAAVADGFGRLAQVIVSGLVAAGLIYAALLLGSVTALLTTGYGLALLLKILLVGALLWLASRNRLRIVPALVDGDASAAAALRRIIDLEVITVLAILALSAVLTSSLDLPMRGMG